MRVSDLLRASKRPLFHIGQGVRIARAIPDFMRLIEFLQVPFVTARNANDIAPSDHVLNVGRPGTYAQRGANFAVQTCDLYIAIGTRLSLAQTGYDSKDYARHAQIVQVDIDQAELDKDTLRDPLKVCMDAQEFIRDLYEQVTPGDWGAWLRQCQKWRDKYPPVTQDQREQTGSVNSYHFIDVLSGLCDEGDTIVTDVGFAFQNTHQAWKVKKGQRLMSNCGLAPMGWGLPAAVGAAFATGGRVICITGEGGLMFNIQELATVMHHRLPIKIFVLCNGGYLTIKQTQELGFDGRLMGANAESGVLFPDLRAIAGAHTIPCDQITNHDRLAKLESILLEDGPNIIEIFMAHDQPQIPRSLNRRNPDGTMTPTKLEDSFPFLPPEVVAAELHAGLNLYPYTSAECEGT